MSKVLYRLSIFDPTGWSTAKHLDDIPESNQKEAGELALRLKEFWEQHGADPPALIIREKKEYAKLSQQLKEMGFVVTIEVTLAVDDYGCHKIKAKVDLATLSHRSPYVC